MEDVKESFKTVHRLRKPILTAALILFMLTHTETTDSSYVTYETLEELKESAERHNAYLAEVAYQKEYDEAYEALVDTLKWHEGYRAYPYRCMANVLTVGYGHAIKRGDSFDYPMSEQTADSLLRADLDAAIAYVERTTYLEHLQKLAIGHFIYALGSGRFDNSTLKKLIEQDRPIDREIVKWIHIRTKNGVVRSEYLKNSRIMELNLYNSQT